MKPRSPLLLLLIGAALCVPGTAQPEASRPPNVLFIIADDASRHYGQAYDCGWVRTPNIDRLTRSGLVFDNAYTPTSKCAPARSAILTGRNPWQLEEAANHQPYFPLKFTAFTEVLAKSGVACGGLGKTWGPGQAQTADGAPRNFGLTRTAGARPADPGAGLSAFLRGRPAGRPFFFWFGSSNPHRPYAPDAAAARKPEEVPRVPAYWPDNETVRRDMLDYAAEVEAFDREVGSLIQALQASGEADSTLVIVTSDHGMPFPRVKGHTYDDAHRIPFIAAWPGVIRAAGRVKELVSFIDLAPTFLELFGADGQKGGMQPITGRSMADLLRGRRSSSRPFVILGRERNDVQCRPGSPAGLGYPARAIREGDYLYVHNFMPDRWPCGNPDVGLRDTDDGPTKRLVEALGPNNPYWEHAFGKRPAEQLFNVERDPDCVRNLAGSPTHQGRLRQMKGRLMSELRRQEDPRVLGRGDVFDQYLSPRATGAGRRVSN